MLAQIDALRQTPRTYRCNSQASPAKAPGFAIRSRCRTEYAHICCELLPFIKRYLAVVHKTDIFCHEPTGFYPRLQPTGGKVLGTQVETQLCFKSVLIDCATEYLGASRTPCRRP